MKTKLVITALLFLAIVARGTANPAGPEQVITLQECLKKAVEYSPRLKISLLEQNKVRYQYRETMGQGLPNINFSGSFDDFVNLPTQLIPGEFFGQPGTMIPVQFGTTYNLTGALDFAQIIYNQTYLSALRVSKLMMEQSELSTESARINLVFEVAQSYYYAQITRRQIENLRSNIQKLERAEQIAQSQYQNGLIKKVDLDRITVNKLNLQTQAERLKTTYEHQLNLQRYYMGLNPETPVSFPDSIRPSDLSVIKKTDLDYHIDIRVIGKQKELAVAGLKVNRSALYPSLALIGSVSYTNQSNEFYVFGKPTDWFNTSLVGLRLNVPVFKGLQNRARIDQSKVQMDQLKITEEDTRRILTLQNQDAEGKLMTAITDELRQRETMNLAERVYTITQEQYQKGMIPLTDLLNAETALGDAQTNHSLALVQMKIAELEYRKSNGTLLEILD